MDDWRLWPTSRLEILVANLELELFLGARPWREADVKLAIGNVRDHIDERRQPWILAHHG